MKSRLSVFSALREMFYLWTRNFWIVTVVAFATGLPQHALAQLQLTLAPVLRSPVHMSPWFVPVTIAFALSSVAADIILGAVSTAAILGFLIRPATEPNPWPTMRRSIVKNTWTLCRLYILIILIAMVPLIVIGGIAAALRMRPGSPVAVVLFAIYIILIKYALANPLVVKEGMGEDAALKRSWQMTRGSFWYVLGCYCFLVAMQQILNWLFANTRFSSGSAGLSGLLVNLTDEVVSPLWIIVSWVMYNQIKDRDREAIVDRNPTA